MLELLAFFQTEAFHYFRHPIGRAEIAHEIVLEADVKTRAARIALARTTSTQLPINAAGFVPLGADDEETALLRHAFSQFDVGAATGHVGGDRNGAALARPLNDLRFLPVVFRIQHVV